MIGKVQSNLSFERIKCVSLTREYKSAFANNHKAPNGLYEKEVVNKKFNKRMDSLDNTNKRYAPDIDYNLLMYQVQTYDPNVGKLYITHNAKLSDSRTNQTFCEASVVETEPKHWELDTIDKLFGILNKNFRNKLTNTHKQ